AAASSPDRQLDRYLLSALAPRWSERQLLLRRHVAAHRGRRGYGYGKPGRGPVNHASLRGFHSSGRTHSRTAQQFIDDDHCGGRPQGYHFVRTAWFRKGNPGAPVENLYWGSAYLDR